MMITVKTPPLSEVDLTNPSLSLVGIEKGMFIYTWIRYKLTLLITIAINADYLTHQPSFQSKPRGPTATCFTCLLDIYQ